MARLGVLKPLRGTESSLANVVLEDGEIAFSYPATGPGTGLGGIKMGDGTSTFSSLPWYITGEGSDPGWSYNTGTDEAALLNNIKHPEYETIGKIYYIQSYWCVTNRTSSTPTISQNMPYKVIDVNHEGTSNTVDLMAMVGAANFRCDEYSYSDVRNAKYSLTNMYTWISDTCPTGYSNNVQAKMCYMTERWREATGWTSTEYKYRTTKCKLLNPYEIFGNNVANYVWSRGDGSVVNPSEFVTNNYGEFYSSTFSNTANNVNDSTRVRYYDLAMSNGGYWWCYSFIGSNRSSTYYMIQISDTGKSGENGWEYFMAIPVIRLSDTP